MHIITGGTGHVGSALTEALLKKGEKVTIISRSSEKAQEWISKGANFAVADIYDTTALHEIFNKGKTVFLLNPSADPMTDTTLQERKTVTSLVEALKYSGVEKVVVESTAGAQPGNNNGDLGILYELEQQISRLSYPYSIIRPAYYMSNWDSALKMITKNGELVSFIPAELKIPMVAPKDIGELAATLMTKKDSPKFNQIQGPETYSPNHVATTFSKALNREVRVSVVPKEKWKNTFKAMGFSERAAESYSRMTEISVNSCFEMQGDFVKGATTLQQYIDDLVKKTNVQH